MSDVVVEERVWDGLERLRLREMVKVLDRVCAEASRAGRSYVEVPSLDKQQIFVGTAID